MGEMESEGERCIARGMHVAMRDNGLEAEISAAHDTTNGLTSNVPRAQLLRQAYGAWCI